VKRPDGQNVADQIAGECLMSRWRMMNRLLTAIYDEELRRFHLKSSQLGLLVAVTKAGPVRRIELGRYLSLDPSTLTRNLQVMLKNGWIKEVPDGGDQRGAPLEVTSKGRKLLESVGPAWQAAQARARKRLGEDAAELVMSMSRNPRTTAGE
jgi:DNA-binding MarR family transcriptional regulator